jgi:hypothetical protein
MRADEHFDLGHDRRHYDRDIDQQCRRSATILVQILAVLDIKLNRPTFRDLVTAAWERSLSRRRRKRNPTYLSSAENCGTCTGLLVRAHTACFLSV